MKINNKGFSLVELLAVVAIIGILSGLAVVTYTGYLENSRQQAYDNMFENMKIAAEQYMIENNIYPKQETFTAEKLMYEGHLNEMIDPKSDNLECDYNKSTVTVTESNATGLKEYNYSVYIECPTFKDTRTIE